MFYEASVFSHFFVPTPHDPRRPAAPRVCRPHSSQDARHCRCFQRCFMSPNTPHQHQQRRSRSHCAAPHVKTLTSPKQPHPASQVWNTRSMERTHNVAAKAAQQLLQQEPQAQQPGSVTRDACINSGHHTCNGSSTADGRATDTPVLPHSISAGG